MIESRMMRWAVHVSHMGENRGTHKLFAGNAKGKGKLGKPRHKWIIMLKWILSSSISWCELDLSGSG